MISIFISGVFALEKIKLNYNEFMMGDQRVLQVFYEDRCFSLTVICSFISDVLVLENIKVNYYEFMLVGWNP